jgi:hypothetical protein
MKISKKLMIGMSLMLLFMLPTFTNFASAKTDQISVNEGQISITIATDFMTMKIVEKKPHFIWWNGNQSTADEMYNVQIMKIQEFFGDDDVLDNQTELAGVSYNLLTSDWTIDIVEGDNFVTVTMTLDGLANGAEIQFIVNIYSEDQIIVGTDHIVEALTEVKFDIIINNWLFSEDAAGLTLQTQILESQKKHRVRIRDGTANENGNATQTMQFESDEHGNLKVAYFEWTTFADIYDESVLVDDITVGTTFLYDGSQGIGPGDQSMVQMYLTYPNYGDSLKMVHDPSIGIYPESFSVPLYIWPIIGGLIASVAIAVIIKKRK